MSLHHYLLIYDHDQQALVEALDLGTNGAEAAQSYSDYEERYREKKGIEIVLVGADSLDTIRQTHAHYFADGAAEPFADLIAGR